MIDWSRCPDVERIPGKVSGRWLMRGTRIPVNDVLLNACDLTPEQIVRFTKGLRSKRSGA
jgi:uncharacterized protein (DUF433 family)